jgi:hypothetical protein
VLLRYDVIDLVRIEGNLSGELAVLAAVPCALDGLAAYDRRDVGHAACALVRCWRAPDLITTTRCSSLLYQFREPVWNLYRDHSHKNSRPLSYPYLRQLRRSSNFLPGEGLMLAPGDAPFEAFRVPHTGAETIRALGGVNFRSSYRLLLRPLVINLSLLLLPQAAT